VETDEHRQRELELLQLLMKAEREIEAGKGYDLDTVLSEANALSDQMQR